MNDFLTYIKKTKFFLNLIILFSWILKFIFFSIIISGFLIFILRIFGLKEINIIHYLILVFLGNVIGLLIGLNKIMNINQTSKWLDDYFNNNDLFISTLHCIERKSTGIFDSYIIDNALNFISKNTKINFPLKLILIRFCYTTLSFVLFFTLLQFINPVINNDKFNENKVSATFNDAKNGTQETNKWFFVKEKTSTDIAKLLFPEDRKLSELADKALSSGDANLLDELLQKENMKMDDMIKNAKTQREKDRLRKKQEQQKELVKSIIEKENDKNKSQENQKNNVAKNDKENQQENSKDEKDQKNQQNNNQLKKNNEFDLSKEQGGGFGSRQSDTGKSNNENNNKNLDTDKTTKELLLTQKKDSSEFEFLLPDKKTKVSLKDIIPDSKRSAESAITRKGIPVEYEDFVRSYFISLLEEMKNKTSENKEEK